MLPFLGVTYLLDTVTRGDQDLHPINNPTLIYIPPQK